MAQGPVLVGIDLGTSALKAVLVEGDEVRASASVGLSTSHRRLGWSEQDPADWWAALTRALADLRAASADLYDRIDAIGLSGQMHGLVVTDRDGTPLYPAILWNDGRSIEDCAALSDVVPILGSLAGVIAMPGFQAPKIRWLQRHEPAIWARVQRVLLPKDWLRLRLTGVAVTDPCDASGALLLDVERRAYAPAILEALGIEESVLPAVHEGSTFSARLDPEIAALLYLPPRLPIATGGGDAACGGIGIGMVQPGDAFISLGTSAQYFITRDRHAPAPDDLIHAFAHALPGRWFQMAALLNGASALKWMADATGQGADISAAMIEAGLAGDELTSLIVLPYLTGERTPLNDPHARGVIFGVTPATTPIELLRGMREGVVLSLMDCQEALARTGALPDAVSVVGGGARDTGLMRLLASGLGRPVVRHQGVETGPALGAARLARMALTGEPLEVVCQRPPVLDRIEPDPVVSDALGARLPLFRSLYRALKPEFARWAEGA